MKALVLRDYNHLSYDDVPTPESGPDEVLIAVKACGICGSDVHGMDGSTGRRRPPIIMGHEAAGTIARVGERVNGWKAGERVTFDSTVYCGACAFCRRGEVNLCENRRVLGVSCAEYRQHGAFADYVVVPERILYRLPDALSFEHAALLEPFTIALHAARRKPAALNDTAVIVGAGMIGIALLQVARLSGFGRTIVVDTAADRLELARRIGANEIIDSSRADPLAEILRLTNGAGADHVFEAVGVAPTVDLAIRAARRGGTVVLVGNVAPNVELPLQVVVTRELSLLGSCGSAGEYPVALDLMSRGALDPKPLLSAVAPLREGSAWFQRLHARERGLLKVVLVP
jgi:L-iditol 2-dehydrogenase